MSCRPDQNSKFKYTNKIFNFSIKKYLYNNVPYYEKLLPAHLYLLQATLDEHLILLKLSIKILNKILTNARTTPCKR